MNRKWIFNWWPSSREWAAFLITPRVECPDISNLNETLAADNEPGLIQTPQTPV